MMLEQRKPRLFYEGLVMSSTVSDTTFHYTQNKTSIIKMIWNTYRAKQISRAIKDVLLSIAHANRVMSQQEIASFAGVSLRMVAYAIEQAVDLGILERTKHRVKRAGRWVNGRNTYQFILKAISEKCSFPWVSSKCKRCLTDNQEYIKQARKPKIERHKPVQEYLAYISEWIAEAGGKQIA